MPRAASIAAGPVAFSTGGPDGRIIVSPCASRCKSWRCSGTFPARCSATRLFCTPVCRTSSSVRSVRAAISITNCSAVISSYKCSGSGSILTRSKAPLFGAAVLGAIAATVERANEAVYIQAVDVTKEHSAENISGGNTLISFATQGLKQSLASHSVHATHLHSLGNQSATFRQIGNFGTVPSGPKIFGENILSFSQLSLSLVLGFFGQH